MPIGEGKPLFFATPAEFRRWLEKHHDKLSEQWVGFYKKDSGRPSITWSESVDEALCFGWIDGIRRSIDASSYMNRFTPRKPGSTWSSVNIRKIEALTAEGRMHPTGIAAFAKRKAEKSGIYSYEQRASAKLDPAFVRKFKADKESWQFFSGMPAGYRQLAIYWVMSAKKEETRERRLGQLMDRTKQKLRLAQFTPTRAVKK
ncbi:MAG TPA: YdeI/OmpD-associated family protein [Gemmatimonadaceae bacterium]|nr:YdeI/OmpD-associated family protein [Gemmatimonadaceae bacterium]